MPTGKYKRIKPSWNKGLAKEAHQMFGKKHSSETKRKMRLAKLGKPSHRKGKHYKPLSEEHKRKISESEKGRVISNEVIEKMRKAATGRRHSKETLNKLRESHIGLNSGSKHPNWQGGKSFEIYSVDWTETLKRSIRERDRYTCQLCSEIQTNLVYHVHHIDYDKKNCNPTNLVTLCRNCHMKTNFNRNYWMRFLNKQLYGK